MSKTCWLELLGPSGSARSQVYNSNTPESIIVESVRLRPLTHFILSIFKITTNYCSITAYSNWAPFFVWLMNC
ncbi:hypothetical protein L1987_32474 [Smallanthus sonchifolius]|uniref:Uncharacterized protein n=1 Tax=Smallanthus sonchifolius TaxID=185202 RepID=A0ACB9HN44_9ASTR|nr:hypothetical protein L1987_32474 [Smallanthus sonchifolius]